jgi:nucleoside-diphosphate-sugar epimerase
MKYTEHYFQDLDTAWQSIPDRETLSGKTVAITGATGLIGSSVADLLLRANEVIGTGIRLIFAGRTEEGVKERFSRYDSDKAFSFLLYDSEKTKELTLAADYIIHAASSANPFDYACFPVNVMLSNFVGLNTLLRTAAEHPGTRVLYISSSEVYGMHEGQKPYSEEDYGPVDILNPRSCYPSAKRCAETLCVAYSAQYHVDTVIVRPGHIYGPMCSASDSKASAQFARRAAAGEDIVMKSAGNQIRSYCYALDCASALLTVLIRGHSGEAYNISNPLSIVTVRELACAFAAAVGKSVVYENPTDAEKAGFTAMTNSSLNSEKLEALGWKGFFDLKRGVKSTLEGLS